MPAAMIRLNRQQNRRLEDYVLGRKTEIEKERPLLDEFALKASTDLGFTVGRNHVSGAAKVVGFRWPQPSKRTDAANAAKGSLKALNITVAKTLIQFLKDSGYESSTKFDDRLLLSNLHSAFERVVSKKED